MMKLIVIDYEMVMDTVLQLYYCIGSILLISNAITQYWIWNKLST